MKDIIIIGTGKAAYLHYNSYNKLHNKGRVFFVDIQNNSNYFEGITIFPTIEKCIAERGLLIENIMVDVCTPFSTFEKIVNDCIDMGIKFILVEKPFIVNENYFEDKKDINIVMIQNYLFSDITREAKQYILENNLEISMIMTNFSKNRIIDSNNKRGFGKEESPTILDIEMPHQIYITNYLLESNNYITLIWADALDFQDNGNIIKNHAYGNFVINKNGKTIIHQSDMTTNTMQKSVTIFCDGNYVLKIEYILYNGITIIKNGSLKVYKDNKVIVEKTYKKDDNIYENIKYVYDNFNNSKKINNTKEIVKFSKEMKIYKSMI